MSSKIKSYKIETFYDGPDYDPEKFMYLDGQCNRCKSGNNSLIVLDFIPNKTNISQSFFKLVCMCCLRKSLIYIINVDTNDKK